MQHPMIVSHNVGGGRYPFRANFNSYRYEVFTGAGLSKKYSSKTFFLRDELKFELIGNRRTWPEQYLFKLYQKLFSKINNTVVLIRNPFAIASSMYSYQLNNSKHSHLWDVSKEGPRMKFVKQYANLILNAKKVLSNGGKIIDPYLFFTDKDERLNFFDFLDLNIDELDEIKVCKKGHNFNLEDGYYVCPCGKLEGFGGFNPALEINADRLLTNMKYTDCGFLDLIKDDLDRKLGSSLINCFDRKGFTDFNSLINELKF